MVAERKKICLSLLKVTCLIFWSDINIVIKVTLGVKHLLLLDVQSICNSSLYLYKLRTNSLQGYFGRQKFPFMISIAIDYGNVWCNLVKCMKMFMVIWLQRRLWWFRVLRLIIADYLTIKGRIPMQSDTSACKKVCRIDLKCVLILKCKLSPLTR